MIRYLPLIILTVSIQLHGYYIWSMDVDQQRPVVMHSEELQNAADYKAHLLLVTGIIEHCIDGYCPNEMIEDFGCHAGLEPDKNYVESLIVGTPDFNEAYRRLKESPAHHNHMVGGEGYTDQKDMAVGYAELNNNYAFVFISANCKDDE